MSHRRQRLADQRGFTMISVVISMMILSTFAVGGWAAANGDLPMNRKDTDRKRAYEAAEAGIQWYTYQLERDTNYWTKCATGTLQGVNVQGTRSSWRTLPNSNAQFAVELIPLAGKTCDPTDSAKAAASMLNQGILRIRSTGLYNGQQRQISTTFRRAGFLDFIWYSKWETGPPAAYTAYGQSPNWAQLNCDKPRSLRDSSCMAIQFPSQDNVRGPMHTEDESFLVCGTPTFGRTTADKIEVLRAASATSWYVQNGGCSGAPNLLGTSVAPSKQIGLPTDNAAIGAVADLKFTGNTCLVFQSGGTTMLSYPNIGCTGTATSYTLGTDTVIYVGNTSAGCGSGYNYYQAYNNPVSCGDVAVYGTYSTNVTIGAANDIIVKGNLVHAADAMMGLVANQFVRVYHPVTRDNNNNCTGNALGSAAVSQIDAAMLATTGSFLTDNWDCGAPLGTLTINGAIAQYWRGAVGTGSAAGAATGYLKNYVYDDRLKYREPPQFLDPVQSSWNVLRQSEQSPVQ
jgi:type II secretory pathway pseudopilin PulG